MIAANELRIGNYVLIPDRAAPVTVDQILRFEITVLETGRFFNLKHVEPIKITNDILLACGFQIGDPHPRAIVYFLNQFSIHYHLQKSEWFSTTTKIQYLHQLQNIYFLVMGRELTIKNYT